MLRINYHRTFSSHYVFHYFTNDWCEANWFMIVLWFCHPFSVSTVFFLLNSAVMLPPFLSSIVTFTESSSELADCMPPAYRGAYRGLAAHAFPLALIPLLSKFLMLQLTNIFTLFSLSLVTSGTISLYLYFLSTTWTPSRGECQDTSPPEIDLLVWSLRCWLCKGSERRAFSVFSCKKKITSFQSVGIFPQFSDLLHIIECDAEICCFVSFRTRGAVQAGRGFFFFF